MDTPFLFSLPSQKWGTLAGDGENQFRILNLNMKLPDTAAILGMSPMAGPCPVTICEETKEGKAAAWGGGYAFHQRRERKRWHFHAAT